MGPSPMESRKLVARTPLDSLSHVLPREKLVANVRLKRRRLLLLLFSLMLLVFHSAMAMVLALVFHTHMLLHQPSLLLSLRRLRLRFHSTSTRLLRRKLTL